MRKFIIIFFSLILANCSLNKDSKYWTENSIEKTNNKKNLKEILKKIVTPNGFFIFPRKIDNKWDSTDDPMSMTLEEYKIYMDEYAKKSKYPDINK